MKYALATIDTQLTRKPDVNEPRLMATVLDSDPCEKPPRFLVANTKDYTGTGMALIVYEPADQFCHIVPMDSLASALPTLPLKKP
jgi:hypothetical protein